jgi:hypothetical protein
VRKRRRAYSSAQSTERGARQYNHIQDTDAGEPQVPEVYGSSAKLTGKAVSAPALSRAAAVQPSRAEHPLLGLQRQYGNRYVQQMLALTKKSEGETKAAADVERTIQRARSCGQPLESGVRARMESSFGADFRGVRVHADARSDTLNRTLNARAFTTGQDIFFRQGAYSPGSSSGQELLTHELTHVVQQAGAARPKLAVGQTGNLNEREAGRVAQAVIQRQKETPEWEKREKRFELLLGDLKPKDPKSNMDKFKTGLDKLLLTLGHEKTAKDLTPKLGLNPKGQLLWQIVTRTGASLWLVQQGKLPNVIPDIPLSNDLLLDANLEGTFEKPRFMLHLKWRF